MAASRARKPVVKQPEIVLTRGMPLVIGHDPSITADA